MSVVSIAVILQIVQKLEEIVHRIKKLLSNSVKKLFMLLVNERICLIHLCCFTFVLLTNLNKNINHVYV